MPVKPIATVRKEAPARMKAIMQEVTIAPISPSLKVWKVREPELHERMRASTTPTAAASVGEARPA